MPGQGEHETERVLRDGRGTVARRVGHGHPCLVAAATSMQLP